MIIGALTIGQSPRDDVIPEILEIVGPGHRIIEKGALDGLSPEEIHEFKPDSSDDTLITRLRDGTEVTVAEKHIGPRLQNGIEDLEREGAELLVLLCTGDIPGLRSRKLLLRPDRILRNLAKGILEEGLLGIVVPAPEQIPLVKERWATIGHEIHACALSPYVLKDNDLIAAAEEMDRHNPALIVLDCIGFGVKTRAVFTQVTGKPVLLPRTVLGGIIKEITAHQPGCSSSHLASTRS